MKRSDSHAIGHMEHSFSLKPIKKVKMENLKESQDVSQKKQKKFSSDDSDLHQINNKLVVGSSPHPFYSGTKQPNDPGLVFRHSHSVGTSDSSDTSILQNTSSSNETFSLYGNGINYPDNSKMIPNNNQFNQYTAYGHDMFGRHHLHHPQTGFYYEGSSQPSYSDYIQQHSAGNNQEYLPNNYNQYTGSAYMAPQESSLLGYKTAGSSTSPQNRSVESIANSEYNGSATNGNYTAVNGSVGSFGSMSDSSSTTSHRQLVNFNPGSSFENNSNHYEPTYDYNAGNNSTNNAGKAEGTAGAVCTSFDLSANENCAIQNNSYYHENNNYNIFQ